MIISVFWPLFSDNRYHSPIKVFTYQVVKAFDFFNAIVANVEFF